MELYEKREKYNDGFLKVSELHSIYYQEFGNPNGTPIVFVHGGPGGGCSDSSSQFFDHNYYRIILFDQRGCGKSIPSAEIRENTTWELVEDMEKLRKFLNIDQWILFGGSWGSTLSLIYAINYPQNVKAMILRGIFLGRKQDQSYLYQQGASWYFPEEYEEFASFVKPNERHNLINSYHKYLNSDNLDIAMQAAYRWAKWELGLITLEKTPFLEEILSDRKANLELARLENHYFVNNIFIKDDNYILNNVNKIENIKTIIVHGRYDMDCVPEGAYLLYKQLKNAKLNFIPASGHSSREPLIASALVDATEELKNMNF
ncbi:Proline iminopeptidase [Metamycoplasma cloacale]|uniref:Proline iminopeptidase n=1 Tax=Metamycoplasma cloacale TaxID=92401 RepID=A0A2Z4LMA8_9BACT|nr:prolyl aminopeptidase [Metamycoplasma cloacale]AWX42905.1 prolyl aminopeptidase [Metamycoplasma cloacale]VEU79271.1 Proline iminopeptidase [Metamycoplasma cloacale]